MFNKARLKLTAWYLLIITIISFSFSCLIYQLMFIEINRFANSQRNHFERNMMLLRKQVNPSQVIIDQQLIDESKHRLLVRLIFINGFILVISGSLSYFLAGRTLKPIQKMTEDQDRFISDASHKLKTPITALKALFEVSLRDKKMNLSEAKKAITSGLDQSNKLEKLSNSLLDLNHFTSKNLIITSSQTSLKKIVSEAISQLKNTASQKQIKIITQLGLHQLLGDSTRLTELFTILIDNAIKYSPKNSQIKITSQIRNKELSVKVIDQGIGIRQSDLNHIFDRFYQVVSSRNKQKNNGYGLGLSIAQNIIKAHQGQIKVSSQLKQGTTFTLSFPNFS